MDATLSREERLRSKRALERLFKEGRGGFVYPLRYIFLIDNERVGTVDAQKAETNGNIGTADCNAVCERPASVLFSVPKKFHKRANKRNLLRRRMREAYRLNKSLLTAGGVCGAEMALVYSVKDVADYKRIEHAVRKIMSQIAERL